MREILFRAKAINRDPDADYRTEYQNGDWVYGWLTKPPNPYCPEKLPAEMRNEDGVTGIKVDIDTLGQYTGLKDKNGVKIFDGDIVRFEWSLLSNGKYKRYENFIVRFSDYAAFLLHPILESNNLWDVTFEKNYKENFYEVIGNVFDNPELLEANQNE